MEILVNKYTALIFTKTKNRRKNFPFPYKKLMDSRYTLTNINSLVKLNNKPAKLVAVTYPI